MIKEYGIRTVEGEELEELVEEKEKQKSNLLDSLESLISGLESEASIWVRRADDGRITTGITIATIDTLRDILEKIEGDMLNALEIQKDLDDLRSGDGDYTVAYQEYGTGEL